MFGHYFNDHRTRLWTKGVEELILNTVCDDSGRAHSEMERAGIWRFRADGYQGKGGGLIRVPDGAV